MAGVSTEVTIGDRIELVRCDDPYTHLQPGSKGTVTGTSGPLRFFNNEVQIHVKWDDGSSLSLIESQDSYRIIERVMD